MNYESPYQALGEQGIRDLVNEFYRIMDSSSDYCSLRAMHAPNLMSIADKLSDYLIGWMGGPQLYLEKYGTVCMTGPHKGFYIGPKERDDWISCMNEAMESMGIEDEVRDMLRAPLYRLADTVKNQKVDQIDK